MRQRVETAYDPGPGISITTLAYDYPAGWKVPEHAHGSDQLIYAISGVMAVTVGQVLWLIPPQSAIWIPAGVPHRIAMTSTVSMRTLYLRRKLAQKMPPGCTVLHVLPLLRELILEAVRIGGLRMRSSLERALKDVIVAQIEAANSIPTSLSMPQDKRALAVAEAVLAAPGQRRPLAALARDYGASVRTMERLFLRDTGVNFEVWRRQLRLMRAIEMLVAGHSVKIAAIAVGYRQPSAFVAMFRRAFGVTPRAWLAALTGGHGVA